MQHSYLFGVEEAVFAASHVLLGQTGEGNAVEGYDFVAHFLKHTAHYAVLTRVDLQTDMLAILLRELQCIGDDTLVVKNHSGTKDSFIYLLQVAIQRSGVDLFLIEFGVRQFGSQVTIVGQQEHTCCVAVEATYRIDTLGTSVANDINYRVALLRIVGCSNGIFRLIEQDIHLMLAANGLVVETHLIGRQHFGTQRISHHAVDGNHTGLDKIIGLTTRADACVSQEFIQTNRFRRVFVLAVVGVTLLSGIYALIAFRFVETRTLLRLFAIVVETAVACRTETVVTLALETRTGLEG